MKILLTGMTGILGSHIISSLSLYHEVYALVRNASQRVDKFSRFGVPLDHIFEGDLEKESLGLSGTTLSSLKSADIDIILHGASSVKFDDKYYSRTLNINKGGTERIINLSKKLNIKDLHFVSTAYAPFQRNPYEISKMAAEKSVMNSGLSHNIYRLGVVVGERKSCAINGFNGFYGYAMIPYFIAKTFRQRKINSGIVELPISVPCSFTSTINIVPVDWVVSQLLSLISLGTFGEIYYITHPKPPLTSWVLKAIFDYLNINGVNYVDSHSVLPVNKDYGNGYLQKLFDKQTRIFLPYLTQEEVFDVSSTVSRLGLQYEAPEIVTKQWIYGLLSFASLQNFGRQKMDTAKTREPTAA
jgi:nucleoside-diphosphate-sugar epimerase